MNYEEAQRVLRLISDQAKNLARDVKTLSSSEIEDRIRDIRLDLVTVGHALKVGKGVWL